MAKNKSIINLSESTLYKSPIFDVLNTDKLYYENLLPEILDITGFNYNIYLTLIYEIDQYNYLFSPLDDLDIIKSSYDLLFTDFVNIEICASII
jgi:hypothetical protein